MIDISGTILLNTEQFKSMNIDDAVNMVNEKIQNSEVYECNLTSDMYNIANQRLDPVKMVRTNCRIEFSATIRE